MASTVFAVRFLVEGWHLEDEMTRHHEGAAGSLTVQLPVSAPLQFKKMMP